MSAKRMVAVYCRVSSDDQRNRETIKTQIDLIKRYLKANVHLAVFKWYVDDGVSGTIPMSQRPQGKLLLADAAAGKFDAIIVVRADRLGRDEIDLLQLYATFAQLGLDLIGVSEPIGDRFMFSIKAVVSADERRKFLQRSAEGMARAAREGRYCGGIVPFGYRVEGVKEKAHLVPDERPFWGEVSAAEIVRRMYAWLVEGKSCYWIADHLNSLNVPTAYMRDGRLLKDSQGRRTKATQGKWRPGRICNLVKNPIYKGDLQYGRRSKRPRDVINAAVEGLVPAEIWSAGQRALVANRIMRRRSKYVNILRSVVRCGICGLNYCVARGRAGDVWLRCNGRTSYRGKLQGKCPGKMIRLDRLVSIVWPDLERFLRDPGDLIDELANEQAETSVAAIQEAERIAIESALANAPKEREAVIGLRRRGKITDEECDQQLDDIARTEEKQRRLLAELQPAEIIDAPDIDLLAEIVSRVDAGLDDSLKQEIVQHLVKEIVVQPRRTSSAASEQGSPSCTALSVYHRTTRARIHRRDQHKVRRIRDRSLRARDRDDPVLERLPHHLEHLLTELRQLVQKQDAPVTQ